MGENKEVEKVEDLKNMELVNMMENLDEVANTGMTETVAELERAVNNLSLSGNLDGIENKVALTFSFSVPWTNPPKRFPPF